MVITKACARQLGALAVCLLFAACGNGGGESADGGPAETAGRSVSTSGKQDTALEAVPAEVLQAAREARPGLDIGTAEHEVRDGREYYDLGGRLADGSELELDMTRIDGAWTVVEAQRDVALDEVPAAVQQALRGRQPDWSPTRIIESDQGDGVVIYEFFGPAPDGGETKAEVKWAAGAAEILQDEWQH
jgi:hypothetical protein